MGQIYHKGKYYSGGGENSSSELKKQLENITTKIEEIEASKALIQQELEKINQKESDLIEQINVLKSQDNTLSTKITNVETTANAAMPKANITNSAAINTFGTHAIDGVHLNPTVEGSIMYHVLHHGTYIDKILNKVRWDDYNSSNIRVVYHDTPGSSYEDHLLNKCKWIQSQGEGIYLMPGGWRDVGYGGTICWYIGPLIMLFNINQSNGGRVACYLYNTVNETKQFIKLYGN